MSRTRSSGLHLLEFVGLQHRCHVGIDDGGQRFENGDAMGLQLVAQGLRAMMDQRLGPGIDRRSGRCDEGDARSDEQNPGLRAFLKQRQGAPRQGQRRCGVDRDLALDLLQRVGIGPEIIGQEDARIVDQEIEPTMLRLNI
jgi:hypothetical protein